MNDLPMGLGMALAQNEKAMKRFALLSEQEKQEVIRRTKSIESKSEMKAFVDAFANDRDNPSFFA